MSGETSQQDWLGERFDEHRSQLQAVAYRMLGSHAEAEDAVQEAWLRVSRAGTAEVENLAAWLTTVVSRVALNMLRSRNTRHELPLDTHVPDPIVEPADGGDPAHEVLLADSVGLALLVVLDSLSPAERLAFVLHDTFAVPFEQVGAILDRSPDAARQLASRARRRVRGRAPAPDGGLPAQWGALDAFRAAARDGDFEGLLAVLDPDVVLRADGGASGLSRHIRGAEAVARQAAMWSRRDLAERRALVNGAPGTISLREGKPFSIVSFTVRGGRIAEIDILADPERIGRLDLTALGI